MKLFIKMFPKQYTSNAAASNMLEIFYNLNNKTAPQPLSGHNP